MSFKDDINNLRKRVLLGKDKATEIQTKPAEAPKETTAPDAPPKAEPSKLEQLLADMKAKQEPVQNPDEPKPEDAVKPEEKPITPENDPEAETKPDENTATPEPENKPDELKKNKEKFSGMLEKMTQEEFHKMLETLADREEGKQNQEPEPATNEPEIQSQTDPAPVPKEGATQEPVVKEVVEPTTPATPDAQTQDPVVTEPAADQPPSDYMKKLLEIRANLDSKNGLNASLPVGTLLLQEFDRKRVPEQNRALVMSHITVNSLRDNIEINSENLEGIVQKALEDHPILNRSNSIASVSGSSGPPQVAQDYTGMTAEERTKIFVENTKSSG